MAPPQAIPKIHLFKSLTYGLLVGAILAKDPRPNFNNGPGNNSNSGRIFVASVYSSPIRIMAPPPGHSNLRTLMKITTACTIAALLISRFSPPKCSEASFKRAQSVNKNCLNDTTSSMFYT